MIPALVPLLIVLIVAGMIYWAFTQLWPLVPFVSGKSGVVPHLKFQTYPSGEGRDIRGPPRPAPGWASL
jgi:hypothetical protein